MQHICVSLVPLFVDLPEKDQLKMELSTQKLLATERQTQFLAMERVEERLASYLLDLAKVAGSDQVQLSMKMKDIALYLGTTPETLSRKFKLLEKMGYLKRTGKQVKILDEDGLLDL
ncbi:hypothetical protein BTI66_00700 [Lactobacillus delbrueckii subsp. bulgaricus]|nr:hypothetical protein [Lactobacillus delbrueckii subsp. bulgaricus]MBT8899066.1 hypothetical protein [Lactobacillus delbrueckii subsp. bulgaricus]MBT8905272.1 hypothetical protein [Lactobacillus delbrueckii subsp. bulgaricus]MBT8911591.1 hypothetical protein [Lactobacillus delbrueckii subsp. bulgaricus]MBT8913142.1 hypothetical protein [Lactobacillus delbrueckii subsp. bulgaricus]